VRRLFDRALDLALPARCVGCGREGLALCLTCEPALDARLPIPAGTPLGLPADIPEPLLQLEWCAPFAGSVRRALHELKYSSERRLADPLGRSAEDSSSVQGLPLVELPAGGPGDLLAVFYSGDGGWRDLDKEIGGILAAHGIATIGVDSLRYFWSEKTPQQVADDLASILRHYRELWGRDQVLLLGYSFGAGILPFAVNRLPAAERSAVRQISLLGLEKMAPFEFHVTDWLGVGADSAARPVLPEVAKLDPALIQCFYGAEEDDTACRAPEFDQIADQVLALRDGGYTMVELWPTPHSLAAVEALAPVVELVRAG